MNRLVLGESGFFRVFPAVPAVIRAGQRCDGGVPGTRPGSRLVTGSAGSGAVSGMLGGNHSRQNLEAWP